MSETKSKTVSDAGVEEMAEEAGHGVPWLPADVPDRSRLIELSWGRVFACDVGPCEQAESPAVPVVLLHGLFLTHHAFSRLVPRLASSRRVVAFDLPGAGDSDRPQPDAADGYSFAWLANAVVEALDAMGVGRFTLVGHDFGGTVALELASRISARIDKLMLISPLALSVSLPLHGMLSVAPSLGLDVFRRTLRRADLKRLMEQCMSSPELLDEGHLHVFWDRLCRWGGKEAAYAMLLQLPSVVRMRDRFGAVDTPTELLWGDRDQLVPIEHCERLASLLPRATQHIVEGCGHNPAVERPAAVANRLLEPL